VADGRDSLLRNNDHDSDNRSTKAQVRCQASHHKQTDQRNRREEDSRRAREKIRSDSGAEIEFDDSQDRGETCCKTEEPDKRSQDEHNAVAHDPPETERRLETEKLGGLSSELEAREARIEPVRVVQARVSSFLDDPAAVHDNDPVGGACCRQAVSDDDGRPSLHESFERLLDQPLAVGVERRGRLV
jgi:hypothetical protein